jgi:hypothetical protein
VVGRGETGTISEKLLKQKGLGVWFKKFKKHLPSKPETLSSNSSTAKKKKKFPLDLWAF